jgi:hypothetical protein
MLHKYLSGLRIRLLLCDEGSTQARNALGLRPHKSILKYVNERFFMTD